ncbi:hypothetical protein M9H77_19760 [Catharanthus roseus]|uniref:Uncharacterized protein n=1 Tax=Catharanthus roseus TaxID=4058 RepID=A0ACC0BBB6_CATRO|nr:hypothetical protein M9H77_19760 [Catharanthus roseus]
MLCGGVRPPSGESGGARYQGWSQGRLGRCPRSLLPVLTGDMGVRLFVIERSYVVWQAVVNGNKEQVQVADGHEPDTENQNALGLDHIHIVQVDEANTQPSKVINLDHVQEAQQKPYKKARLCKASCLPSHNKATCYLETGK